MRKIVLYVATSIDGLIAGENDNIKWSDSFPNPRNSDYGYGLFYDSIDVVLMGANTFRVINNEVDHWPYPDKDTYLITHATEIPPIPKVHILGDNWITEIKAIKEQKGKNIWLVGGGEITCELLRHDLIDKIIISQFPIILGSGTPLFTPEFPASCWEMSRGKFFNNGVIQAEYLRKRKNDSLLNDK